MTLVFNKRDILLLSKSLRSLIFFIIVSLSLVENFRCLIEVYAPAAIQGGSEVVKIKPEAKLLIKSNRFFTSNITNQSHQMTLPMYPE